MNIGELLGLLGPIGIGFMLFVLGLLSSRLGSVTRTRPYHLGLYFAAILVWLGGLAQLLDNLNHFTQSDSIAQQTLWIFLRRGLPAVGSSLGLLIVWYYWSWLLAERD